MISIQFFYFLLVKMGLEERLHKKILKLMFGSLAPREEPKDRKDLGEEVKASLKPKIRTITSFFSTGIKELKRDLARNKKNQKAD